MKKIFSTVVGIVFIGSTFSGIVSAKNPYSLSQAEITELLNSINNELNVKDIPALQDKIIVYDKNWNVLMDVALEDLLEQNSASDERTLINKSELLMEYAGNSYYMLED